MSLRSSATPEDGRRTHLRSLSCVPRPLRSSAALEGDRHVALGSALVVAYKLRSSAAPKATATLPHHRRPHPNPGCDPRSPRRATATASRRRSGRGGTGCDFWSSGRATATTTDWTDGKTVPGLRSSGTRSQGELRSSAAPGRRPPPGRHRTPRTGSRCCDSRSPRATATAYVQVDAAEWPVLRSSAAPEDDRHGPPPAPPQPVRKLRSSVAPRGDRHPPTTPPGFCSRRSCNPRCRGGQPPL